MTPYLITILLVLPGQPVQPELTQVMPPRVVLNASSQRECQVHADRIAAERRAREAETIQRLRARVVGECKAVEVRP
jgi:hypothetical protein